MLKLVERDAYLAPYSLDIEGRYRYFLQREREFTKNGRQTLSNFASGYLYFGLHRTSSGWACTGDIQERIERCRNSSCCDLRNRFQLFQNAVAALFKFTENIGFIRSF